MHKVMLTLQFLGVLKGPGGAAWGGFLEMVREHKLSCFYWSILMKCNLYRPKGLIFSFLIFIKHPLKMIAAVICLRNSQGDFFFLAQSA